MNIVKQVLKIIIAVTLLTCMIILTSNSLPSRLELSKYYFAGGSSSSIMLVAASSIYLQFSLTLISGFFLFMLWRKPNLIRASLFILTFFLWIMSGRTVGLLPFPDGKIKTGWFYIKTGEFTLCNDTRKDCETVISYQTKFESTFLWSVKFKNDQINRQVFIGPVVWYQIVKMLKGTVGSGTYTR